MRFIKLSCENGSSNVQVSKYSQDFSWTVCLLKMGTIGSLETSVTN